MALAFLATVATRSPARRTLFTHAPRGGPLAAAPPRRWMAGSRLALRAGALEEKTIVELKELLREQGLPVSGRKAELIARLEAAAKEASGAAVEEESTGAVEEDSADALVAGEEEEVPGPKHWRHVEGPVPFAEWNFTENATHRPSPWGPVIKPVWEGMEFGDDQGKMLDGSGYMCLDGVVRKGDPYSVNQTEDFYGWLTEWVVAARTGQLRDDDPLANKAYMPQEDFAPGKGASGKKR